MTRLIDQLLRDKDKPKATSPDLQAINPPDEQVTPIDPETVLVPEEQVAPVPNTSARLVPTKEPERAVQQPKVLFIKCLPTKDFQKAFGAPVHYSDLIKPYADQICGQYDVPHLSLAGSYGQGYKDLAALVAQTGWGDHSAIYVNPMRSKGCEHVLDILVALADVVVEGT